MDTLQFEARKREHILHSLDPAHQASGLSGLDQVHLVHEALPDLDFADIDLRSLCLGRPLATPFYVAGMTAGHQQATDINRILALACQERGWAMGVGSQRRDLEGGQSVDRWKQLREEAPDLVLLANLGISQLIRADLGQMRRWVHEMGAQALAIHLNSLQEAMQPEGTPQFRGGWDALKKAREGLGIPLVLKETGCGFSVGTIERLASLSLAAPLAAPLAAIDVSGLGGTHWGRIEGARSEPRSIQASAAVTFANWGESTARSVLAAVKGMRSNPQTEIWASGGVRSGLDAAKFIALGAHRVGYAQPALEAALKGPEALRLWMETQEYELKVALFCTGSDSCHVLRNKEGVWRQNGI